MLWAAAGARATRIGDMPPPTAEAVRRAASAAVPASAAGLASERQRLRAGLVTAVDREHGRVQIDGVWFAVVDGQTRLLHLGRVAEPGVLAAGQYVRYTLAAMAMAMATASGGATLGLVYVP